jgi:hypothetical protein
MSLAREMAFAGQNATAEIEEEICQNLRTGKLFTAKIAEREDILLSTELGPDSRASHWVRIRRQLRVDLAAGDTILCVDHKYQILTTPAPDDGIAVHLKYLAEVLTDKDAN